MCLITREYIMGLENLQQFFETTPSENPVIYYGVHISLATCLYLAFCDRAFEESSDTLHCNTEKDKSCLVKLHERSAGIYYVAKLIAAAWI